MKSPEGVFRHQRTVFVFLFSCLFCNCYMFSCGCSCRQHFKQSRAYWEARSWKVYFDPPFLFGCNLILMFVKLCIWYLVCLYCVRVVSLKQVILCSELKNTFWQLGKRFKKKGEIQFRGWKINPKRRAKIAALGLVIPNCLRKLVDPKWQISESKVKVAKKFLFWICKFANKWVEFNFQGSFVLFKRDVTSIIDWLCATLKSISHRLHILLISSL